MTRALRLAAGLLLLIGLLSVPSHAQAATTWTSSCLKTYIPPGTAMPKQTPSASMGVIGHRPVAPGDDRTWNGDDRINSMAYRNTGSHIMAAGGEFDSYIWGEHTYARKNFVAFNTDTGKPVTPTKPITVTGGEILTVAFSCTGSDVYLGGSFHQVSGITRNYAAKVNLASGRVEAWNPNPNGIVESIGMMRDRLIVAGDFSRIGGVARTRLASVSQSTGKPGPWLNVKLAGYDTANGTVNHPSVTAVVANPNQSLAVVIGNFNTVNGHAHRRIFLLNLKGSTAALYPWATPMTAPTGSTDCSSKFAKPELGVAFTPGGTRFVTASTGGAHYKSLCDTLSLWDAYQVSNTKAMPLSQQQTGGDTLSAVACTSRNCWGAGHERWGDNPVRYPKVAVTPCSNQAPYDSGTGYAGYGCKGPGAQDRPGILSVAIGTMKLNSWNPGRSRQVAMHNVFVWTPGGLFLGSDGDSVGGENIPKTVHNDLVKWPF